MRQWAAVRIYIDTNWFLSHYQAVTERKSVLLALRTYAKRIVLTDQTELEFRRNRDRVLMELRRKIQKSLDVQPWAATLVHELDEYKELVRARDEMKRCGEALVQRVDTFLSDPYTDPLFATFQAVRNECKFLYASAEIIQRAQVRKSRGQPPSSNKRDTIGDEIIWETLLAECKEDLAIVSQDGDFLEYATILKEEYLPRNGRHLLYVGPKLSAALERFGERSPALEELERSVDPTSRCTECGASDWEPIGPDIETQTTIHRCSCGSEIFVT